MQRLIDSTGAQIGGYGLATLSSMVIMAAHQSGVLPSQNVLEIIPQWLIATSWTLSTAMVFVSMGASAYKKIMEGKASVLGAEKDTCHKENCPYRAHWIDTKNKK